MIEAGAYGGIESGIDGEAWRHVIEIDPDKLFKRNERQKLAFKAALSGEFREILFGGGMGGGKSVCLLSIAKAKLLMHPGCTVLIVRQKLDLLRDQLFKSLLEIIPQELWESKPRHHPKPRLRLKNGSEVIGVGGQDPNDFRGWNNVAAILVDEAHEIAPKIFKEMITRFRVALGSDIKPLLFLTSNPAPGYLDDTYARPVGGLEEGRLFIQSLASDNGYIEREAYARDLRATRSEAEFQRDYMGKWGAFQGLVFPHFREETHVEDFALPSREMLTFSAGMDHAWNNPTVIALGAMTPGRALYIYDELWMQKVRPDEIARAWKRKRDQWELSWEDSRVCADTSLWKPQQNNGEIIGITLMYGVSRMKELGDSYRMNLIKANKSGQGLMTAAMMIEDRRIIVHKRCIHIARSLASARWKEQTPTQMRHDVQSEEIHPKGKDEVDAVKYLVNDAFPPEIRSKEGIWEGRFQREEKKVKLPPKEVLLRHGEKETRQGWRGPEPFEGRGWDGLYPRR